MKGTLLHVGEMEFRPLRILVFDLHQTASCEFLFPLLTKMNQEQFCLICALGGWGSPSELTLYVPQPHSDICGGLPVRIP